MRNAKLQKCSGFFGAVQPAYHFGKAGLVFPCRGSGINNIGYIFIKTNPEWHYNPGGKAK